MNWSGLEHEPPAQPALGCGLVGGGDLVQRHDRVHPGWQAAGRGAGEQIGQSRTVRARYHDVHALRALTGVSIQLITGGQPPGPWPAGRRLTAGPAPGPKPLVTSPGRRAGDRLLVHGGGVPLPVEVVPAGAVGPFWVYRQGPRIFARPLDDITRYWHGVPFLAPEAVLLIKARPGTNRPRTDDDQRDFEAALPVLSAAQRSWLKDAIERPPRLQEPAQRQQQPPHQHRWAAELASSFGPAG